MPKRIQRKRTKGWRMPVGARYVGRPSKWGNPFDWDDYIDNWYGEKEARQFAVEDYRAWLSGEYKVYSLARMWILEHLDELRGYDLACWCPLVNDDGSPCACHADVLLEMANKPREEEQNARLDNQDSVYA